jgi:hypothetical protein
MISGAPVLNVRVLESADGFGAVSQGTMADILLRRYIGLRGDADVVNFTVVAELSGVRVKKVRCRSVASAGVTGWAKREF